MVLFKRRIANSYRWFPGTLVGVQVVAAAALVLSARAVANPIAWLITALGVGLGLWAMAAMGFRRIAVMPHLSPRAVLITRGPYRFVRHPMYTALLLFAGSLVFTPFREWKIGVWLLLLLVLIIKSQIEERHLRDRFASYGAYARRTGRFLPATLRR